MISRLNVENIPAVRQTPTHFYFAPHPHLRPYIAHYTISFPNPDSAADAKLTIIPDASGCLTFIQRRTIESACWGAATRTVMVDASPDAAEVYLFVEFLPGGHRRLTGLHQPDLLDQRVPLALVAPALDAGVRRLMETVPNVDTLVHGLDSLFLTCLAKCGDLPSSLAGLNALPAATVHEIACGSCYSRRQLDRIFREGVGMSPKMYLRILRINRCVKLLRPGALLTQIAQEAGYFDQSHFIRDFKAVCGVTPGIYLQNMSVFYNEPLKF